MEIWSRFVESLRRPAAFAGMCAVLLGMGGQLALAEEFLPPEQAFAFSSKATNGNTLHLHWDIAPGYHLYRDRIKVKSDAAPAAVSPLTLPPGTDLFDTNFNKTMVVYTEALDVDVNLPTSASPITVGWQGCADGGLCYPPASVTLQNGVSTPVQANNSAPALVESTQAAPDSIASTLASGSLLQAIGVFWLAGLLLAFTPCVLPMVPILSSLIAGQSGTVSRSKGFMLSLAYSLGMALVYAGFGVAAGLAGEGLAAALQNPWVLGSFALMLSAMALSMFGVYDLQMPSAIQSRATEWSNRFKGGSLVGVFLMGGVSALVVGPCVAAPLAGALVYISQTRNVLLGGSALFAMALGMSVPLLLVGISAGSFLPRAGAWMERVKQVFGMMLLAVAIWMVSPVLAGAVQMLLWSAWLLAAAALLGVFASPSPEHRRTPVAARATGTALAAVALLLLIGAASGGNSVLQPLAHIRVSQTSTETAASHNALRFERVASRAALDTALAQAQSKGETVMLDFYADWCVACKELETFTFSDPKVQQRLGPVRLLQADVTANTDEDKALLKRFSLFGPPGIVFFDGAAAARITQKVVGYQNGSEFLASLDRALPRLP